MPYGDDGSYDDIDERFVDSLDPDDPESVAFGSDPIVRSPFVKRALASELPAKDLTPYVIGHSLSPNV